MVSFIIKRLRDTGSNHVNEWTVAYAARIVQEYGLSGSVVCFHSLVWFGFEKVDNLDNGQHYVSCSMPASYYFML